jgi:mono/diheme cytochrome c family protein
MLRLIVSTVLLAVFAAIALSIRAVGATEQAPDPAAQAIKVLTERCVRCHGQNGVAAKNVFVLERDRLIASRIVVPGDPDSQLLKMVESNAMPPGGPP